MIGLFFIFIFKNLKKIWSFQKISKIGPVAHGKGDRPPVAQAGGTCLFCKKIFANRFSVSAARGSAAVVERELAGIGGGEEGRRAWFVV